MKPLIYITEKEYYKAEDIFKSEDDFDCKPIAYDEEILSKAAKTNNAFGVIIGVEPYKGHLYSALPKGGIIARFGVGHDGVDKRKATENSVIVTNTPGVLDDSVAEHSILLMGCLVRQIAACHGGMKNNQWGAAVGSELCGKTLLVIGCGHIGRKTAKIAALGFGMRVIGYDVSKLNAEQLKREFGIQSLYADLNMALAEADFVSLHIPSVPETRHFVNAVFLSALKPSCVLVNTARGPLVDEIALYDTLKAKRIVAASLDVFENEPYVPVDPHKDLRKLDNVLLTPHLGSSTFEACRRMASICLKNINATYKQKYHELDILNPEVLRRKLL